MKFQGFFKNLKQKTGQQIIHYTPDFLLKHASPQRNASFSFWAIRPSGPQQGLCGCPWTPTGIHIPPPCSTTL